MRDFALAAEELNRSKHKVCMPAGDVVVGVRNWGTKYSSSQTCRGQPIDIAPLIHFYKHNPHLHFIFEDSRDEFATLFSVRNNALWWTFFENAVWEIRVWPEFVDGIDGSGIVKHTRVHIDIDEGYMDRWMRSNKARRDKRMDGWLPSVGLGALKGWGGLRVYQASAALDVLYRG